MDPGLSFIAKVAATSGGVPLMALNTVVSESVDIVVHCTRTTDGPSDEAPTTEDPHLHGDRGVPALGWIAGGDGSPADAGRLDLGQRRALRPPPAHLHERFTRSVESLPTAVSDPCQGGLAIGATSALGTPTSANWAGGTCRGRGR